MSDDSTGESAEARRFSRLWDEFAPRVQAYAIRRVGHDLAEEVLAETFLIAWRRLADVPGDPLPWLLVVARNTISSQRRSAYRARAIEHEMGRIQELAHRADSADSTVLERDTMLRALATLTSAQREALLLVSWDGLSPDKAAAVAGCTTGTFRVRLHRARQRMRAAATDSDPSRAAARTDRKDPHLTALNPKGQES